MDDLIKEFLVESHENLDLLDRELVELEDDPNDKDRLARIFRAVHTIKGTAGFFDLAKLESITHAGENLLAKLRDGELSLTSARTSALLAMLDAVRALLDAVENTGGEGDADYSELVETLGKLQAPDADAEPSTKGEGEASSAPANEANSESAPEAARRGAGRSMSESSIRVDVKLLDDLMNMVGELVLVRNQILQLTSTEGDPVFQASAQRLNLLTSELQEGVMKTRMQPIGGIWTKLPRVVRDLALDTGKQVQLHVEGRETELDRKIIEAIKDPLTHLVRNAVDHGIEPPEVRQENGKDPVGNVHLRAFHEGGQVNIEISDDGSGLDLDKLRTKAIELRVIRAEQAAALSPRQVANLIFAPGFSTAEKVTKVSGRGVGMDVVKTNIEKIGGVVDISSRAGEGTTLRIKIPLTLAIIPALIVRCGSDRHAIPQVNLLELVHLTEDSSASVEEVQGTPVLRLRGKLLPLVYLREQLDLLENPTAGARGLSIVVLQADGRHFGLVVDAVLDTQEIVVKPLGKQLKHVHAFAGATIMGDGRIALILDVLGIAQSAGLIGGGREAALQNTPDDARALSATSETLLLLQSGERGRIAIPLGSISRLEEFPRESVEISAGQEVVQYRDGIMPLVNLSQLLGTMPAGSDGDLVQVVVHSVAGHAVGLVVERIVDIVTEELLLSAAEPGRTGIAGTAVVEGRTTDILDLGQLLAHVPHLMPSFEAELAGV